MLYVVTMIYIGLIFIRPTELIEALSEVPVVSITAAFAAPLFGWAVLQGRGRLFDMPQDRLLWVYWIAIVVSNLAGGWLGGGMLGVTSFAQVMFQYFLIRSAVHTIGQVRGAVVLLACYMLLHAVSGIQQWHTGYGFSGVEPLTMDGETRIRSVGIFNDPNDLALAMLIVIPFLFVAGSEASMGKKLRALALAMAGPLLLAFFYTNSRGGMLGIATGLVVIALRRFGARVGPIVIVAGLAGVAALGSSRMTDIDADEDSAQGRIQAWGEGLEMLKSQPLTGVGYDRFTEYHFLAAHNSFVQALAELGLFGGSVFIGMVFWYFESLRRVGRLEPVGRPPLRGWLTGFLAMGAGFFVAACFLSRQYNPVLFTVIALGACFAGSARDERAADDIFAVSWADRGRVLGFTFATVVAIWLSVRLFATWGGA